MAPKRKKSEPTPAAGGDEEPVTDLPSDILARGSEEITLPTTPTATKPADGPPAPLPDRSSWYNSWRSSAKALPAAAQIAKESISVAQGATSESSSSDAVSTPNRRTSTSLSKSVRGSSRKSIPLAAEATKVHATTSADDKSRPRFTDQEEKAKGVEKEGKQSTEVPVIIEEARLPPEPPVAGGGVEPAKAPSSGPWYAWWSRPDGYGSDGETRSKKRLKMEMDGQVKDASSTPLPGTPVEESVDTVMKNAQDFEGVGGPATGGQQGGDATTQPETKTTQQSTMGWFGLWSSAQNQNQRPTDADQTKTDGQELPPAVTVSADPQDTKAGAEQADSSKKDAPQEAQVPPKSSGWAFWSTDKTRDPAPTPGGTQKQIGELAVADTPSQSHPEAAQFNEQRDEPKTKALANRTASLLKPKRGKPTSKEPLSSGDTSSAPPTPLAESSSAAQTPTSEVPSRVPTPPPTALEASSILTRIPDPQRPPLTKSQDPHPNLILPKFHSAIPPAPPIPSYMERLTAYLAQTLHLPNSDPPTPPSHVYASPTPPKIRKAVALGVHGFFPSPLVQKFIGQPKGTSVRFANFAGAAIKTWCAERQPDIKDVEVEKVALEGEGLIADRVQTLWKLLLNWLSHLRNADFIFVACHSQGVPVAVMLVAKLIQLGCLAPNVRIGVCAMAGINLGPFGEYRSRFFAGSALELFEFCDPRSAVSRAYVEALTLCLRNGVRVTFAGSLDDQLVSLESSLFTPLHHPYIYRALFVDGKSASLQTVSSPTAAVPQGPDFLTHLVVFASKLRNLGVGDHGLIRELSAPLAGSLVGGDGHSRIYDEVEVYRVAIDFAVESTDVETHPQSPSSSATGAAKKGARPKSLNYKAETTSLPTAPALAEHLRRSSLTSPTSTLHTSPLNPSNHTTPAPAPVMTPYTPPLASTAGANNPFYLPWAVRGLLEEDIIKKDVVLQHEVRELVREFAEWRPRSKVLRDVKWRLEGLGGMV